MTINYSKQVLLKRGNTAISSTYVGPLGEVTYDTDLHQIRVHDGERAGGWIVPGGPEYDLLVPLIGNAAAQQTQINSLLANANVQQAFIESIVNQGNVDPGTGNETFWFNTEDGRLYIKQANVWVDSSPAELPNPSYVTGIMEDFAGNIVPAANVTYSLGTQQAQWKDLWVSNNTIYLGNTPITVSNGSLLVGGNVISGGGNLGKFIFDTDLDRAFITTTDDAGGRDGYDIFLQSGGETYTYITIPKSTNADAGDPVIISGASENSAVRIDTYGGSWTFGNTGNLALPNGTGILGDTFGDGGLTLRSSEGKYSELGTFDGNAYIWVADAGYDGPSSNSAVYIATGYNTQSQHRWTFDASGTLSIPGAITMPDETGLYSPGHDLYITAGNTTGCSVPGGNTIISSGLGYSGVAHNGGNVTLRTGDYYNKVWNFDYNGNLTFPANLSIGYIGNYIPVDGTIIRQVDNEWLEIRSNGVEAVTTIGWTDDFGGGSGNVAEISFNNFPGQARIVTGQYGEQINTWQFRPDGTTTFPNDTIKAPAGSELRLYAESGNNYSVTSHTGPIWEAYVEDEDTGANVAWAWIQAHLSNGVNSPEVFIENKRGNDGVEVRWTFDADGNLTLPQGGTITEGGGLTGAIRLTPAGGANADQALLIYPTAGGDGNHIHLTAGGDSTELYLGNDFHYVKLVDGGNVEIRTNDTLGNTGTWNFGTDGTLTLPGKLWARASDSGSIAFTNDGTTERGYLKVDAGYNMTVNAENNYYVKRNGTDRIAIESTYTTIRSGTATRIETNLVGISRTYTFGETGVLGLPYESYLESTPARNLNLGAWGNISIIADAQSNSTTSWKFGADGNLTIPGNLIGNFISSPAPSISGFGNANFTGNITAGNILLSSGGEIKSAAGTGNVVIEANDGVSRTWTFKSIATLNLPSFGATPGSGDGAVGDICRDGDVLYFKTSTGWKTVGLTP